MTCFKFGQIEIASDDFHMKKQEQCKYIDSENQQCNMLSDLDNETFLEV